MMKIEIADLLEKLLGDIDVYCETCHDERVMNNLDNYAEAGEIILQDLLCAASYKNDYHHSAKKCGEKATSILINMAISIIDSVEIDDENKQYIRKYILKEEDK